LSAASHQFRAAAHPSAEAQPRQAVRSAMEAEQAAARVAVEVEATAEAVTSADEDKLHATKRTSI